MVEITLRMEEEELETIIFTKFDKLFPNIGYTDLYKKYFSQLILTNSATFFYGPTNLDTWIKDTVDITEIITPASENYEYIYDCLVTKRQPSLKDGRSLAAEHNDCLLLEYYS